MPGLLAPDRARRDESALQGNYSIQQQVGSTLAVQASYVLNRAAKLHSSRLINPINPATGRRDIGAVWLPKFAANMTYLAMQMAVNKRLSKGLNFDMFYTLSKGMQYNTPTTHSCATASAGLQLDWRFARSEGDRHAASLDRRVLVSDPHRCIRQRRCCQRAVRWLDGAGHCGLPTARDSR